MKGTKIRAGAYLRPVRLHSPLQDQQLALLRQFIHSAHAARTDIDPAHLTIYMDTAILHI